MEQKAQNIQNKLDSDAFKKTLKLAHAVERFSGGGVLKKLQRLFLTPQVYIPYLLLVRLRVYRRDSVVAKLFWGRTIHTPLQDYDSLALRTFGFAGGTEAELKLARFFVKNVGPGDVLYDVGANYGFFTYLASELCHETHAFEPMPTIAEVVRKNTSNDASVFVNEIALSDHEGTIDLHVSESSGLSTINASTIETHSYTYNEAKKVQVAMTTLDAYTSTHTRPTFLKIDVEGAEEQVIKGGSTFLAQNAPVIAMEVWGTGNGGEISMRAVDLLRSFGYTSYAIDSEGVLSEAVGDISAHSFATGGDNFIFKKK